MVKAWFTLPPYPYPTLVIASVLMVRFPISQVKLSRPL